MTGTKITYRDVTGRRIQTVWHADDTVDVQFWSGGENRPYVHRGIPADLVEDTIASQQWRQTHPCEESHGS